MQNSFVPRLRSASRDLVRELGFMSRTVAGTSLSPSGVHALIEIDSAGQLVAKDLAEKLLLEKSTVSRLVGALVADGEIEERRSASDGRSKDLILTREGAGDARGDQRVCGRSGPRRAQTCSSPRPRPGS